MYPHIQNMPCKVDRALYVGTGQGPVCGNRTGPCAWEQDKAQYLGPAWALYGFGQDSTLYEGTGQVQFEYGNRTRPCCVVTGQSPVSEHWTGTVEWEQDKPLLCGNRTEPCMWAPDGHYVVGIGQAPVVWEQDKAMYVGTGHRIAHCMWEHNRAMYEGAGQGTCRFCYMIVIGTFCDGFFCDCSILASQDQEEVILQLPLITPFLGKSKVES